MLLLHVSSTKIHNISGRADIIHVLVDLVLKNVYFSGNQRVSVASPEKLCSCAPLEEGTHAGGEQILLIQGCFPTAHACSFSAVGMQ